ncbi:glycosyltransferase family 4 protein [Desulfuromonas sp. TF]|uniref:glycosyltransferase family 4 protein n=1 Tax=Desulfuromonas sp. TF TaxID=1232410 RepID=UPI0003F82359|nr:glycosyltransferase family 4 protein [Desulfuromonas sp. TF]
MPNKQNSRPIIFLNQTTGKLFHELVEDSAKACAQVFLFSGPVSKPSVDNNDLNLVAAPTYNRKNYFTRLCSWIHYFLKAFLFVFTLCSSSLLFIVTNPPFLGLVGLFFKIFRKQNYVVLVYDIYPDLLVGMGTLRNGWISQLWTKMNRLVLENSSVVFTIGDDMAHLLEKSFDLSRTIAGRAIVIPNWSDVDTIKPLAKDNNAFAIEHDQVGKITVLYSGNMGNTHDIESILAVARELRDYEAIHFLFIGEGAKRPLVERTKVDEGLQNISLLPFQSEEALPYSMAAGDIGIVSYQSGTEACIVPSKTYYYMAAGLVPLVISGKETDLSRMLVKNNSGIFVRSGDIDGMKRAILILANNGELLKNYKIAARATAEQHFSRHNIKLYIDALKRYELFE